MKQRILVAFLTTTLVVGVAAYAVTRMASTPDESAPPDPGLISELAAKFKDGEATNLDPRIKGVACAKTQGKINSFINIY